MLLAYGGQLEEMPIRSGSSDGEFRTLVGVYRDGMWPEERSGPVTASARAQRIVGFLQAPSAAARRTTEIAVNGA